MLTENVRILERRFSSLKDELQKHESRYSQSSIFQMETARNGSPTVKVVMDGKTAYLHSKYNPQEEAKQLIGSLENVDAYDHVFFYGVGLGYHIEAFRERYPTKQYTTYEPFPELMFLLLDNRRWDGIASKQLRNVYLEWDDKTLNQHLQSYVSLVKDKVLLVTLAAYERLFPDRTKAFTGRFSELVRDQLNFFGTNSKFEIDWTLNSMRNFPKILQTQNIVGEKRRVFSGKPVVLASAGPSLQDEFDNLKYIKEHGLAYICAVGSASRSLIKAGVLPDLVTTYDPKTGQVNHEVFAEIFEQNLPIPMVYGSTVGYRTLENYPGPLLHMFINQDTVAPYYLGLAQINERQSMLSDAPSIAVVTLQLLSLLQCSTVILVGQNFGYRNNQFYAPGIQYATRTTELTEAEKRGAVQVPGVDGVPVDTTESFNQMRKQMESYIRVMKDIRLVNATKGGAQIEGTTFVALEQVISEELKERVVEDDWYAGEPTAYDFEAVSKQAKAMQTAMEKWEKSHKEVIEHFRKFDSFIRSRNAKALAKQFPLFDHSYDQYMNNPYHNVFIQPVVRNLFQLLVRSMQQIRETGDPIAKARAIIEICGNYVYACAGAHEGLKQDFESLQSAIVERCS